MKELEHQKYQYEHDETEIRKETQQLKESLSRQESVFIGSLDTFAKVSFQKLDEIEKYYRQHIGELNRPLSQEQLATAMANRKDVFEKIKLALEQERQQALFVVSSIRNSPNPVAIAIAPAARSLNVANQANSANPKNKDLMDNEAIKQLDVENKLLKQVNEDLINKLNAFQNDFTEKKEKFQQKLHNYEQACQDLAQKLKDSAVACDEMQKKFDKAQKATVKHKHKKNKLKEQLKEVKEQVQNLQSVQVDIVNAKQTLKSSQQEWDTTLIIAYHYHRTILVVNFVIFDILKGQLESTIKKLEEETELLRKGKVEMVKQTMVEINNLRDYIKLLQKQLQTQFYSLIMNNT
ncbi:hypothetical protein RFI_19523 [Reticulomyxa filosa]|uniref:Uncharacterized protein n=1 Tax=Reticulomyxa filosa TaxID=46433 RepID=X6MVA8_RETFI|nr:hypothetical protein RFI_19523 [Reticulomyxa filosa]|eukprot:ETO17789.1 hypothetical protein RFI_19523 [Reticulomyxa filosa]